VTGSVAGHQILLCHIALMTLPTYSTLLYSDTYTDKGGDDRERCRAIADLALPWLHFKRVRDVTVLLAVVLLMGYVNYQVGAIVWSRNDLVRHTRHTHRQWSTEGCESSLGWLGPSSLH
jgi:hypothetical protein